MDASQKRDLHDALWRSHGGFDLVLAPVIFALLGLWIDSSVGTRPLFTLILLAFGAVGAAVKVYYDWRRGMDAAAERTAELRAEAAALREQAKEREQATVSQPHEAAS